MTDVAPEIITRLSGKVYKSLREAIDRQLLDSARPQEVRPLGDQRALLECVEVRFQLLQCGLEELERAIVECAAGRRGELSRPPCTHVGGDLAISAAGAQGYRGLSRAHVLDRKDEQPGLVGIAKLLQFVVRDLLAERGVDLR